MLNNILKIPKVTKEYSSAPYDPQERLFGGGYSLGNTQDLNHKMNSWKSGRSGFFALLVKNLEIKILRKKDRRMT